MIDWNKLRNAFFKECTEDKGGVKVVNMAPHGLFEWYVKKIGKEPPTVMEMRSDVLRDAYVSLFCEKQELEFEGWATDEVGQTARCSGYFFDFLDIVLDMNSYQPKGDILKWYDDEDKDIGTDYRAYIKILKIKNIKTNTIMTKLKVGDKFMPRKPKHPEHPLYNEFWGLILTVKDIGIHWIKCYENNLVFPLDWCEKVEERIPDIRKTIDWEQRRYEIAKDFMTAQINSLYLKKREWNYTDEARYAVNAADVLIKQLQESPEK